MKKIFTIFFFLYTISILPQEKVYMSQFETINMHKDYRYSTSRLLKMYIEQESKYEIIINQKDTAISETKEDLISKAKQLNYKFVLIGSLNRIGESVIVTVTLYNVETGLKVWTSLQKAGNPSDLDPIMQKVALALNGKIDINKTNDIYNVTQYDAKELNKIEATSYWGVEIGGGTSFISGLKNNFPAGFGIMYSGDLRNIIFDIKGNIFFSDFNFASLSIIVNYPINSTNYTPFISGGLGFSSTNLSYKKTKTEYDYNNQAYTSTYDEEFENQGLSIFFGGGYIFNRSSNINLRLNATGFVSCYRVNSKLPIGFFVNIAVLF